MAADLQRLRWTLVVGLLTSLAAGGLLPLLSNAVSNAEAAETESCLPCHVGDSGCGRQGARGCRRRRNSLAKAPCDAPQGARSGIAERPGDARGLTGFRSLQAQHVRIQT